MKWLAIVVLALGFSVNSNSQEMIGPIKMITEFCTTHILADPIWSLDHDNSITYATSNDSITQFINIDLKGEFRYIKKTGRKKSISQGYWEVLNDTLLVMTPSDSASRAFIQYYRENFGSCQDFESILPIFISVRSDSCKMLIEQKRLPVFTFNSTMEMLDTLMYYADTSRIRLEFGNPLSYGEYWRLFRLTSGGSSANKSTSWDYTEFGVEFMYSESRGSVWDELNDTSEITVYPPKMTLTLDSISSSSFLGISPGTSVFQDLIGIKGVWVEHSPDDDGLVGFTYVTPFVAYNTRFITQETMNEEGLDTDAQLVISKYFSLSKIHSIQLRDNQDMYNRFKPD
ncbi:MAG: hypothetical protein QNK23_08825 [Crocinitomicaceae bacterium]|nr:hypothetical protein [Crocinitomicaceae bacterium]